MTDRITIRLGPLSELLSAAATKSGRTISEEARVRLAASFGIEPPRLPVGSPGKQHTGDRP